MRLEIAVFILTLLNLFELSYAASQLCVFVVGPAFKPRNVTVSYDDDTYKCLQCSGRRKVLNRITNTTSRDRNQVCSLSKCRGVICGQSRKCAEVTGQTRSSISYLEVCRTGRSITPLAPDEPTSSSETSLPLIIGFGVGGVMLAVVIVGVFLGRANRAAVQTESMEATTPVSMSYSEWISNYSTGGRGSKMSNMRVQESGSFRGLDDSAGGLAVYSIVYGDDGGTPSETYRSNHEMATVIEVDGMTPYEEPEQFDYEPPSSDVIDYATSTVYDGGDVVQFEWTDDYQEPYEYYAQESLQSVEGFCNPHSPVSMATNPSYNVTDSLAQSTDDVEMMQSRRHESWSDESSYYDDIEAVTPLNHDSARKSCLHESRIRSNTENLKHVFVDVHRSMTCSCDDLRNSQVVFDANNDKLFVRYNDVTKHVSFRAFKNQFVKNDKSQIPNKLQKLLYLSSFAPPRDRKNRRYSV